MKIFRNFIKYSTTHQSRLKCHFLTCNSLNLIPNPKLFKKLSFGKFSYAAGW